MRWPFSRTRSAPEAKSLAAPTDVEWAIFTGGAPSPIAGVGTDAALRDPTVVSCIQLIAGAVGSLDLALKEITDDGVETDATGHPVARLLRRDPNDWLTWPQLLAGLTIDAMLRNDGGQALVGRAFDGRVVDVVPMRRGIVQVVRDPNTGEPTFSVEGREYAPRDVLHVESPYGRAPLDLASSAIAIAASMATHAARHFASGGQPRGLLRFEKGMPEDAVRKSILAWRQAHDGPDSGGKTAILHDGADWKQVSLSSADSQFLEMRKFQVLEICRAFRVPPSMVFDLDRATWSNSEQMGREFLSYCLEPWLQVVEGALRRALISPEERDRYVIRIDRDDLTRADLTARATAINSLIASRVLNPNEGRGWLGMAPREGGDEYLNPNITTCADSKPAAVEESADA